MDPDPGKHLQELGERELEGMRAGGGGHDDGLHRRSEVRFCLQRPPTYLPPPAHTCLVSQWSQAPAGAPLLPPGVLLLLSAEVTLLVRGRSSAFHLSNALVASAVWQGGGLAPAKNAGIRNEVG